MLKKLLKYDLSTVLKYWWIIAATSLVMSAVGGFAISVLVMNDDPPTIIILMSVLAILTTMLTYSALTLLSSVFIYIRFYKHFFSDEGYLTFTLPVKLSQLLNSKLITAFLTQAATVVVVFLGIGIMLCVGLATVPEFWKELSWVLNEFLSEFGGYATVYIIEFILMLAVMGIAGILFIFICITFGAIIAKKFKALAAIGIYYGASLVVSGALNICSYIFGIDIAMLISLVPSMYQNGFIALLLLTGILICAVVGALLYLLEFRLLDRRLNLQ